MQPAEASNLPRWTWTAVGAIAALGLALRIAAGTGGLWIDEAWSAMFAHESGSPLAVFLYINHDNNHHLNTLWLQLVGLDAPPLAARALSIASGTATILVAGMIGARRGPWPAVATALLFAVSEAMVTYGSEARGYAPMMLAAVTAFYLVDRWLEDPARPRPARPLAWCALLGMLSHLTMILTLIALGGWVLISLWQRSSPREAIRGTWRLFWPSALVSMLVVAAIFGAAAASDTGFQLGSLVPFSFAAFAIAMSQIVSSSLGPELRPLWLLPVVTALLLVVAATRRDPVSRFRMPFYLIAILGLPLAMVVLQPGNGVILRYYLLSVAALLILAGERIGFGLAARGWRRWASAVAIAAIVALSLGRDVSLIRNARGLPDGPVLYLAAHAPLGAEVAVANPRAKAVLYSAAAWRGYRLEVEDSDCPEARYLLVDRDPGKPAPADVSPCGLAYRAVASARTNGLSGGDWVLYERRLLQSASSPVSDPPPAP